MSDDMKSTRARIKADASAQRVARTYAEALYAQAEESGEVQRIESELEQLTSEVVASDPLIRNFFGGGVMGRERRAEAIQTVFAGRVSDLLLRFLQILNNHERLDLVRAVLVVYQGIVEERSGSVRVQVTSAAELAADQRERLVQKLRDVLKREPILETKIDPSILGGLIVQIGDWLYDAGVRHQLGVIRTQMIESRSHEVQVG